ncbi:hypothetical protein ACFLWF_01680 [Chloroflexota bacterium]
MLFDDVLPTCYISIKHSIKVRASASNAYRAMKELRFQEISPLVNLLLAIRAFPERLLRRDYPDFTGKNSPKPFLEHLVSSVFIQLAERPEHEFVFGFIVPKDIGCFWKNHAATLHETMSTEDFMGFNHPEYAKVAINFLISETDTDGIVCLSTESRIKALSPQAMKKFSAYWRVIYPGSALIRGFWLRAIKHRAEKN